IASTNYQVSNATSRLPKSATVATTIAHPARQLRGIQFRARRRERTSQEEPGSSRYGTGADLVAEGPRFFSTRFHGHGGVSGRRPEGIYQNLSRFISDSGFLALGYDR